MTQSLFKEKAATALWSLFLIFI